MKLFYIRIVFLITFAILFDSCTTPAPVEYPKTTTLKIKKMFKHGDKSQNYSRIRLVNVGVQVYSIDQKKIGPIVNVDTGELTYEAHVTPGEHDVLLKTMRDFKSYGSYSSWKEARKEISFDAKANHVYSFTAIPEGNKKILFSIKDHGTGYDVKCGNIISLEKSALKNYDDIKNKRIPVECY